MTEFCQRIASGLEQATFEQKCQLIELLIDRVVVTMEEVEIRSVIPTSSRSVHIRFCHLHTDYFRWKTKAFDCYTHCTFWQFFSIRHFPFAKKFWSNLIIDKFDQ
jgi:hypothetical protein